MLTAYDQHMLIMIGSKPTMAILVRKYFGRKKMCANGIIIIPPGVRSLITFTLNISQRV